MIKRITLLSLLFLIGGCQHTYKINYDNYWKHTLTAPKQSIEQSVLHSKSFARDTSQPSQIISKPIVMHIHEHMLEAKSHAFINGRTLLEKSGLKSLLRLEDENSAANMRKALDEQKAIKQKAYFSNKPLHLPHFSEIEIIGPFNVKIVPDQKQSLSLAGAAGTLQHLSATLQGQRLILWVDSAHKLLPPADIILKTDQLSFLGYQGSGYLSMQGIESPHLNAYFSTSSHVNIESPHLNLENLILNGHGKINIKGLCSKHLAIDSHGADKVTIEGISTLEKLYFAGNTQMNLHWVSSPSLQIIGSGTGSANLAGHTKYLDVQLYDQAVLDAKYLRTDESLVKTHHVAQMYLHSIYKQNVLATDKSRVFYFNNTKLQGNHQSQQGDVINLGRVVRAHS